MKRRQFITLVGGAAACSLALPFGIFVHNDLTAHAEPGRRMRRIGVLMGLKADDPEGQARLASFAQGLQQAGWTVGENIKIEYRWGGGNAEIMRKQAAELVGSAP